MRLDEKVMKLVLQELVHSKLQCLMHQPGSFSEPVSAEKPEHSLHLHGAAHLSLAQHSLAAWRYLRGRGYRDLSAPESHILMRVPPVDSVARCTLEASVTWEDVRNTGSEAQWSQR